MCLTPGEQRMKSCSFINHYSLEPPYRGTTGAKCPTFPKINYFLRNVPVMLQLRLPGTKPVTSKMDLLNSGMSHQPQFNFVCALVSFEVFEFADDELLHVSCMSCT